MGNYHVQFLGGKGSESSPTYPTAAVEGKFRCGRHRLFTLQ